ncbi:hypothetical protein J437_LFUL008537 [Ladona fulva]|uniref:Activator of basal transcription 1 n=1 Tax=Ladona fulva TaxID=123851 RepID=A0A8K0K9C5_LADFU|nr:hypothetical protein J437_LFUL008537 [Ladona fulva]
MEVEENPCAIVEIEPAIQHTKPKKDVTVRKSKPGIIYLSTIPKHMNVTKIREIFGQFGDVGRVFLQPNKSGKTGTKKSAQLFSEGWVEYRRKKVAKQVAIHLNNKQLGVRKRSKFHDFIWNIKYLPRFKWIHLSERLAYEKAAHRQRLRLEVSQAKKEANYFALNVDRSEKERKKAKKLLLGKQSSGGDVGKVNLFGQRKTESEIMNEKQKSNEESDERTELLKSWFGSSR